jgi:hypothetical protein
MGESYCPQSKDHLRELRFAKWLLWVGKEGIWVIEMKGVG